MIPIRQPNSGLRNPTAPTAPPGLTKGMARISWSKGGREDINPGARRVPRVPGYAATLGPPGQLGGILPTPLVPGIGGRQGQRQRFLAYAKSGKRSKGPGTGYDQLLQAAQGGGKPMGPAYQGYISQLTRTLIEGM